VEPHSFSPVSRVPMHQVLSVGDFSCGRKTLPVKSAVVTSLIGMTLRIVQNNTTLTTPARRKIESLVDGTRLSETVFDRTIDTTAYQNIVTANETGWPTHSHNRRTAIGRKRIVYAT
jgi:hypothetical protein